MGDDRAPENEDVDARIAPRGNRVARKAGTAGRGRAPWLDPWETPRLKFGNDPVRYFVVKRLARCGRCAITPARLGGTLWIGRHDHPPDAAKIHEAFPGRGGMGGGMRPEGAASEAARIARP